MHVAAGEVVQQAPGGQRQLPAINRPQLHQRQATGVHQPGFHRIWAGFALQRPVKIRQRHQHVGMPALQETFKVLPLPGKRAEEQAHQLRLIDAVDFAELRLMHFVLLATARLPGQAQRGAAGLGIQAACTQFMQLYCGLRIDECRQWPGIRGVLDAKSQHAIKRLCFDHVR